MLTVANFGNGKLICGKLTTDDIIDDNDIPVSVGIGMKLSTHPHNVELSLKLRLKELEKA
jgi:hypothetical protein